MKLTPAAYKWLQCLESATDWRSRKQLREATVSNPRILYELFRFNDKRLDFVIDRLFHHEFDSFEPRPDTVGVDEQTGFLESQKLITMAIGGNGSGKTYIGGQKAAKFLQETEPPGKDTLFWCVSDTYEQVCKSCWFQKLRTMLPAEWIEWDKIIWYKSKRQWPLSVPLKPWPNGGNWLIEFKSYEQGRELMQAAAIGGAWFTEQFPFDVFLETVRGAREYGFPGSIWAEFTPIDPVKSMPVEEMYLKWCAGEEETSDWAFFRLNTELAAKHGHVEERWLKSFAAMTSDDMKATRLAGEFASYQGVIYPTFSEHIHVVDDIEIPHGCFHKRSFDWGASEEHPLVCLFGAKDGLGRWIIYKEYWCNEQSKLLREHLKDIKRMVPWPKESPYHGTAYGDPSRPDMFNELRDAGIQIAPANNQVFEGIETVRSLLKPQEFGPQLIISRKGCPKLVKEMKTYRWRVGSDRGLNPAAAKPQPLKKWDDCCDALRYLVHSDRFTRKGEGIAIPTVHRERKSVQRSRTKRR